VALAVPAVIANLERLRRGQAPLNLVDLSAEY